MKPRENTDGGVALSIREYDIAAATAVKPGQIVKLVEGLVVLASATETGRILGVAAEGHSGTADALNPRANGTRIRIYDGPGTIFECPAPVITATGGTATTVVTGSASMVAMDADDYNGGYLKLIAKAAASTNTDVVGVVKRVTDFADNAGTETFTVASGGTAAAGDKYQVFPPLGMVQGGINAAIDGIDISSDTTLPIKVVGHDLDRGILLVMACLHFLGCED